MAEITLQVSDEIWKRLHDEAQRRQMPLESVILAMIHQYLDDQQETILADLQRRAMIEALGADSRPLDEIFAALKKELGFDPDQD